jgi:hypothetical protein
MRLFKRNRRRRLIRQIQEENLHYYENFDVEDLLKLLDEIKGLRETENKIKCHGNDGKRA